MMLKKTIYEPALLLSLLLTPVLAACSADPERDTQEAGEPVVFSLSLNNKVMTRAEVDDNRTIDNLWPKNTQVTIANNESTKYSFTTGASPSTSSSVAIQLAPVGEDTFIWPTTDPSWSFSAWYPAGESPQMSQEVAANQTVYNATTNPSGITDETYNGYDLLYCPSMAVSFRQKPVTLNFLHQLARVMVIVNSSYTETKEAVTGIQFGGGKVALSGTIQELTETSANGVTTWNAGSQNSTVNMRDCSTDEGKANNIYTFECMLPPQAYKESNSLVSVTNLINISTSTSRSFTYDHTLELKAGYQYTYNLLISEQGVITIATVKVTDWTDGSTVSSNATIPDNSYPANPIE